MALRHDWIRAVCKVEPTELVLETATGESMTPTIRDGNTLLIDTTDRTFRNFGIYVLEINGQRLVKRVQRKHDGSLVLISDNSAYQPDAVGKDAASDVTVVGRESKTDSLFDPGIATFEDDRGAYNQKDAEGFIRLNALRMRIAARRRHR